MAANPRHYWTAEEFLAFEAASKFKHELVNGEVYDMTGGTGDHSQISASAIISVGRQLDNSSCTVNTSDMMLKVSNDRYLYPDMSVVCGQPFYEDDSRLVLLNPTLVVEVTSQTTATYDRGYEARVLSADTIGASLSHHRSAPNLRRNLYAQGKRLADSNLYRDRRHYPAGNAQLRTSFVAGLSRNQHDGDGSGLSADLAQQQSQCSQSCP